MNPIRRWRTWLANRRHNRALRAALLACPGRQLMFCVVKGRLMVAVEGDAPTVPPGPPVDFHWNGDEYIAVERKEEATGGGTNGGGHG